MQTVAVTLALIVLTLAAPPAASGAQDTPAFKRSDPALLNTAGTFQLVEFYHPT
jgi:hypothetical protein